MRPYLAPDGSYSATYPRLLRRAGAAAVDWTIAGVLFLVASLVGGIFQALGDASRDAGDLGGVPGAALLVFSQLVVAAPVVAYFAGYWRTGSTLGMRAFDIELVREETGAPPEWARAVLRAVLAFVVGLAGYNAFLVLTGDPPEEGLGDFEETLATASTVVAAAGLVVKAAALVDGRRRSLLDRVFGLLYVEELIFVRHGPWPWSSADVR